MPDRSGPEPQNDHEYIIQMFDMLRGVQTKLGDMETTFTGKLSELERREEKHDLRIDQLENWRNRMLGALGVIGAMVGAVMGNIFHVPFGAGH